MAKWWADHLRVAVVKFDNGGAIDGPLTALIAQTWIDEIQDIDTEEVNRFEKILAEAIQEELDHSSDFSCTTDYEPDSFLQEAAKSAGFNIGTVLLPIKSKTFYREGKAGFILGDTGERQWFEVNQQ